MVEIKKEIENVLSIFYAYTPDELFNPKEKVGIYDWLGSHNVQIGSFKVEFTQEIPTPKQDYHLVGEPVFQGIYEFSSEEEHYKEDNQKYGKMIIQLECRKTLKTR